MMSTANATTRELMARAQLFQGLAHCFVEPGGQLEGDLSSGQLLKTLTRAVDHGHSGASSELIAALEEALPAIMETREAQRDGKGEPTLRQEYTYLFHGRTKVPLYETSYGVDLTFARTREMADIGAYHAAFGFEMSTEAEQMTDHLGVQLEFLALLCFKEGYARERGWTDEAEICRDARSRYLTEHLTGWLPSLRSRLEAHARLPFYPAIVRLASAAVSQEHAAVGGGPPIVVLRELIEASTDDQPLSCGACPAAGDGEERIYQPG